MNVAAVPPASTDNLRPADSSDTPVPGFDALFEGAKAQRGAGSRTERASTDDTPDDSGTEPETGVGVEIPAAEPPAPEEPAPADSTADALLAAAAAVLVPEALAAPLVDTAGSTVVAIDAAGAGTVIELAPGSAGDETAAPPLVIAPATPDPAPPSPAPEIEIPVGDPGPALAGAAPAPVPAPADALPPAAPPADALPPVAPPAATPAAATPAAQPPERPADGPLPVPAPPSEPGDGTPAPVTQVTVPEEVPATAAATTVAALPTVDLRDADRGADPASTRMEPNPAAPAAPQTPAPAIAAVRDAPVPSTAPQPAPAEQLVNVLRPLRYGPDGAYRLSLEMRPPELGRIELRVELRDGVLHATMRAEHESTQQALRDAMTNLRARLETEGIRAGRLSVDDTTTNAQGGQRHAANGRPDESRRGRTASPLPTMELAEPAQKADDGLDVRL